ncbi:hypothetical protein ABD91_26115 [Lysinibacillus sphaericus]|uniref:hypothetical protein n=1 Tax=Lysinibacillus sphaericus TaxID=1421 RepID=UPI0018CE1290|nr:hypothetical protein [Lysinibacillus sphaericus]MBG9694209.1 hypothetical protein [Lysinibacillus sphaericus]
MNKMKWLLLSVMMLIFTLLAGCADEKPKEDQVSIQAEENILDITAGYEGGFFGKGAYYVVETDVQTYSLKTMTSFTYTILNNEAEADRLYLVGEDDDTPKYYEKVIALTPKTYKKLSKKFTEKTGMTLKYEGQTIDEYIKEENEY